MTLLNSEFQLFTGARFLFVNTSRNPRTVQLRHKGKMTSRRIPPFGTAAVQTAFATTVELRQTKGHHEVTVERLA